MNNQAPRTIDLDELVVNWHILEACNYGCRYCYAKWNGHKAEDVWRDALATEKLLDSLWELFGASASTFEAPGPMRWHSTRLSLAGGEPTLLGKRLPAIVHGARSRGFAVSIITNGSKLKGDLLDDLAPYLSILGLSIDSIDVATNNKIGRSQRNNVLVLDDIASIAARARSLNPDLKIKINTVVNAANAGEDLSALIEAVRPDKWKVLQMLPVVTDALAIEKRAYDAFLKRHDAFSSIMTPEGNEEITQSYIMVDPLGRFFQNTPGERGYLYSAPITSVGAASAFAEIPFESSKFAARYGHTSNLGAGR